CAALRPPPITTVFPYTTLFRSSSQRDTAPIFMPRGAVAAINSPRAGQSAYGLIRVETLVNGRANRLVGQLNIHRYTTCVDTLLRSEEHTSELQSRENLVCRLLL